MDVNVHDVSGPLKHLFSLDFSRTSPLLDEISRSVDETFSGPNSPKKAKKVRFADPFTEDSSYPQLKTFSDSSKIRGILKKTLSVEESEYALSKLSLDDSNNGDYSSDLSSLEENSEDDENEEDISSAFEQRQEDENFSLEEDNNDFETENMPSLPESPLAHEIDTSESVAKSTHSMNDERVKPLDTLIDVGIESLEENITCPQLWDNKQHESLADDSMESEEVLIDSVHSATSLTHSPNRHILNVLSKVKIESKQVHMKDKSVTSSSRVPKKPKVHFCLTSLYKLDSEPSKIQQPLFLAGGNQSLELCDQIESSDGLKFRKPRFQKFIFLDVKSAAPPQTLKLHSFLKKNTTGVYSAKELKSSIFRAWHKMKKEKSLIDAENSKTSTLSDEQKPITKPNVSTKGYIDWMKRKELNFKIKKRRSLKPASSSDLVNTLSEEEKRKRDEERILAYNSWKQQKDEQLKLKLQKERKRAKLKQMKSLKDEEIRKKDAASAFLAWKSIKQNYRTKNPEQVNEHPLNIHQKKLEEIADRDVEAQEAYLEWLQLKERIKTAQSWNVNLPVRPPWNPPG